MASKVTIIAIGKLKNKAMIADIGKYERRLSHFCKLNLIEHNDIGIKAESERIAQDLEQDSANTYILDANGKEYTSKEFSELIKKTEDEIRFIIGGPDGISEDVKKKGKLISMSRMTFAHEMCRLFLYEQIYRSYMIINNRTYDK